MRSLIFCLLVALLGLAPSAHAQGHICDDVADLADDWADVADALEETAGTDVGDLDLDRLERDVNALLPDTESLGEYLVDEGSRKEQRIGNEILDMVDGVHDVDGDDLAAYMVDRIDDLVDSLDYTVDFCDAVNE